MSRIHGRNGIVYVGVNSGDLASPAAFLSDWSINFTVAKVDVTAMGDQNLIWTAGLPDASGDFSGFYDTASAQTYAAAQDGLPRNFYLYPSSNQAGQYFFGQILPDYALSGSVTAAVTLKSTWNAASRIQRYPTVGIPGS
jgi:hypothetical protein